MATLTDPARELGEISKRLTGGGDAKGAKYLATAFEVEPWSTDFFKIVACILERTDLVEMIVRQSNMDDDHKENAVEELDGFRTAFAGTSLSGSWNTGGHGLTLMQRHGRAIQFLSPIVRQVISYPQLTESEAEELITLIDRYLDEVALADEEPEFIRRAITDGLRQFQFQLRHMGWMGAGYALAAFREVMLIYEFVHRQHPSSDNVDAVGVLRGLGAIVAKFKERVDAAKGWADTAETVWKAYQVGSSVLTPLLLASRFGAGS